MLWSQDSNSGQRGLETNSRIHCTFLEWMLGYMDAPGTMVTSDYGFQSRSELGVIKAKFPDFDNDTVKCRRSYS